MKPSLPLFVPIRDLGSQSVCDVGVDLGLSQLIRVVGVRVGSDLGEDPIGLLDDVLVNGVGLGATQVADPDCASEDEDGDEAAKDGDFDVVEGLVDLVPSHR